MTFDTFESLMLGDKVKRVMRKRVYTITGITEVVTTNKRLVVVGPIESGMTIFAASSKNNDSHYINWDRVRQ
jgi:hypothetical protein